MNDSFSLRQSPKNARNNLMGTAAPCDYYRYNMIMSPNQTFKRKTAKTYFNFYLNTHKN